MPGFRSPRPRLSQRLQQHQGTSAGRTPALRLLIAQRATAPAGGTPPAADPIDPAAFAARLDALGPFEPRPLLAVAVSGGADSLALALLAHGWAKARGGRIVALTVDHRLRRAARAEAVAVGRWLRRRGIPHAVLPWRGAKPQAGLQEAARAARYALLTEWCRTEGCLHLLTAHHREDQAETLLLRLGRASGLDGLAGMAAIADLRTCRLVRPLLDVPRAALAAYLSRLGQAWVEDPSNADPRFARARLRQAEAQLAEAGLSPGSIAEAARKLGRVRRSLDAAVAAAATASLQVAAGGYALLEADFARRAEPEVARRLLARVLAAIGGAEQPPRGERLDRLFARLQAGEIAGGATLGGCRLLMWRRRLLVCREMSAVAPPVRLRAGAPAIWDGRIRCLPPAGLPPGLTLGALGADRRAVGVALRQAGMPAAAVPALPALRRGTRLIAVPALGFRATGRGVPEGLASLSFCPAWPVIGAGFTVA